MEGNSEVKRKKRWMKFESDFFRKKKEGQKDETEFSELLTMTRASEKL